MKQLFSLLFLICILKTQAQTVGLFYNNPGATDGYILFAPTGSDTTYLIDKCGKKVHTWKSNYHPGQSVHLLADGTLLHTGSTNNPHFTAGGTGGIIEELNWDGNVNWSYQISDNSQCQHHDAIQLSNGNIVAIVWVSHTSADAIANGRNPSNIGSEMWADKIVEINPGTNSIVWEWNTWDHLIQNYDAGKLNYGVIADHPELIDINLGLLGGQNADWTHCNGLDYNAALDQIMVSCHNLNEVWIIDHSTTTAEAASHSGGNSGSGGDLMYRWGNPSTYDRGTSSDQKFYGQHNPSWIPQGYPGEGKIMVFNNGMGRPGGNYSSVETFTPPAMVNNNYPISGSNAFEPSAQDWIYTANPVTSMFSQAVSGAQRLVTGNTIICVGQTGNFLEIDTTNTLVWKYVNPVGNNGIITQGQNAINNMSFRCVYYAAGYSGFAGHTLAPGSPIEKNPLNYTCESNISSIEQIVSENGFLVYPNPFTDYFVIHCISNTRNATVKLLDVMGRVQFQITNFSAVADSKITIPAPAYCGIMILTITDEKGNLLLTTKVFR